MHKWWFVSHLYHNGLFTILYQTTADLKKLSNGCVNSYTIGGSRVPLSLASLSKFCFLHWTVDGCDTACTQTWTINCWDLSKSYLNTVCFTPAHRVRGKVWNKHMKRSEGGNSWGWVINRNITRYNNSCRGMFVGTQTRSSVINK